MYNREMKERTQLVRMAIADIMREATTPQTGQQMAHHPAAKCIGATPQELARRAREMCALKNPPFPIDTVLVTPGTRGFFDPTRVAVDRTAGAKRKKIRRKKPEPPAATPESDFTFNPIELENLPEERVEQPTVQIPSDVKTITLSVHGVNIRIEMSA